MYKFHSFKDEQIIVFDLTPVVYVKQHLQPGETYQINPILTEIGLYQGNTLIVKEDYKTVCAIVQRANGLPFDEKIISDYEQKNI